MTDKHSPGPWIIDKEKKFDCCYRRYSYAITDVNGNDVVLFDPSEGEYAEALDMDGPDAQLITAAPEMLEALKQARSEIWRLLDTKNIEPKQACQWPEIVLIDELIKKATGETR